MTRRIVSFFLFLAILWSLCACSSSETGEEKTSDAPKTSFPEAADENGSDAEDNSAVKFDFSFLDGFDWCISDATYDVINYPSSSMDINTFHFTLISATPLTEEDVQVAFDSDWEFTPYLHLQEYYYEGGRIPLDADLYMICSGLATAEECDAYNSLSLSAERMQVLSKWFNAYYTLDVSEVPGVYQYDLTTVCMDNLNPADKSDYTTNHPDPPKYKTGDRFEIDWMDLTVKGETRRIDLGRISYYYEDSDISEDPDYRFVITENWQYKNHYVDISSNGLVVFRRNVEYTAKEDVTLTGIRFYRDDEIKIREIRIKKVMEDDFTLDIVWDGIEPLELSAGDVILMTVVAEDPWFANSAGGWKSVHMLLDYQVEGETYSVVTDYYCHQYLTNPFAYIAYSLGYDVLPLYYEDDWVYY